MSLLEQLKIIWEEILETNEINISDNFFDLGGDSFSALEISLKSKEIGISLSVGKIFELQTIEKIVKTMDQNS